MNAPIIKCHNLSHSYSGKTALSNISFTCESGEPIGLVGPNGAGKSTLLNILCGFMRSVSGDVTLFGHKPGASALSGRVSALPQDAQLDPAFSIGEQLYFYARLQGLSTPQAKHETSRVLEAVALKDVLKEKPSALSHGMAKRAAIAQALIGKPKLILLDEPTAGLDPVNMRKIRTIITELSPVTTFIISSHDLAELGRLCQQILLLDKGIMSTMQLNASENNKPTRFLTLQMEPCSAPDVQAKFNNIAGISRVSNPQKNEFIIEYNPEIQPSMDLTIITCINDNNWQYRQLSQGKTLEEKLFFDGK
ncbi:MAG: ABC transporter ATP-binding protein [Gammaproteobacteria bacterium]|jgi:ABC-2 type transport system ATP-binding protein|nr:ABC transporter ATP-binding protein [Gammaproteobacteria bacterium]MBT4145576.1 ABC transporter ATP-binding protein [Gammaproteobacteria bacterium]MBT5223214.1 ABC transporter ATP-binding protein [Gammaproteobacteria bacterium]MBT5825001.1 ABC transporter ATP-binding protein [Gammaproteobacteria bacterium]MBT5966852.1 ABC transporter ATP-binding protein [Gammaproteobacteria bacterium]